MSTIILENTDKIRLLLHELSDERAYTLIELSNYSGLSRKSTEKVLNELTDLGYLKIRINRERKYWFAEHIKITELSNKYGFQSLDYKELPVGMKYLRHCYKHLAGYAGVKITESLIRIGFLIQNETDFTVTKKGWNWFSKLGISKDELLSKKSRLTKSCLDFSERKPHLGGKLGDALMSAMLNKGWMKQVPNSREIEITELGKVQLEKELGLILY